jgi:hypothetical protein
LGGPGLDGWGGQDRGGFGGHDLDGWDGHDRGGFGGHHHEELAALDHPVDEAA